MWYKTVNMMYRASIQYCFAVLTGSLAGLDFSPTSRSLLFLLNLLPFFFSYCANALSVGLQGRVRPGGEHMHSLSAALALSALLGRAGELNVDTAVEEEEA